MSNHPTGNTRYPDLPRLAVGAVVFHDDTVLLVQRGKAPGKGMWSIPGGSVRLGESLQAAAEREIQEETGVAIRAREVIFAFDTIVRDPAGRVQYHYVIVDLVADYRHGQPRAADDAADARWVSESQLAELTVQPVTRRLLADHFHFGKKGGGG